MTFLTKFTETGRGLLKRNTTVLLAIGLGLLLIQDVFGTHGVLAMHRSQVQAAQIQAQLEQTEKENHEMEQNVKSLKSDPSAIERIARDDMGLARPGEYIFKVPAKPGEKDGDTSGNNSSGANPSAATLGP